jgi:nitrogen fixation protein NifT
VKITISKKGEQYRVYVPKKDLEEPVTVTERPDLWGGWIELANGWRLDLPPMADAVRLPITVEARKHADAE